MRKGTLFIAPAGARNKKGSLFKEIVSLCPEGDYSSVLYLSPNSFVLREAERQFFSYLRRSHKKSTYIPFQSFTIKRLAADLHEIYGKEDIISDRIRPLILCEILQENNIGYARLLSDLLKKIGHYVLDKDLSLLKEEIGQLIFEEKIANRAVKAIETLEIYEDELNKKGLIDSEGILKKSISIIKEHINQNTEHSLRRAQSSRTQNTEQLQTTDHGQRITDNALIKVETLVIDGFFDPTPLEVEIIKTLIDKADNVYILIEEGRKLLKYFQSHTTGMATKRLKSSNNRENTGYYSYPSMEEEIEGIAGHSKSLLLEGVKPWEIAVTFPVLSKYLPMLRRVFQKHGIPVSIGEYVLSNARPFVNLEEMITCIEDDYPGNDFLSFLTSTYFPAISGIVKEWAVTYAYRAGIVKGKPSWLSIKEILLNSPENEISETDKERLGEFQKGIKSIIDVLEEIKQKKDLLSFVDEIEYALYKFGFFDSLAGATPYGSDISNKIANQLSELRAFAKLYGSRLHGVNTPVFYLRQLLKNIKGFDKNTNGVRVVPFELAATLEVKAIFFGGMVEGDFPSRPEIDPILPEKVKKALGMPYLEYYLNRQKRYFKRLLNIPVNEPCFSCPSADSDKVFLPSPFLDWGKTINLLDLNIFTEDEIMIREDPVKPAELAKVFWGGEQSCDKEAHRILSQRIGAMSRNFFSVTDIDFYRRCPLRFYIEKVLCLQVEKPPKFEVEAKLWGRLAHKTMEYLFKEGEIDLDDIDKRLFKGLEISLKQFPIGDFWSRVAREIFHRLLPLLKKQEADIRLEGFSPYMVEKNIKVEINNLRLKGKIDRTDHRTQSTDNRQWTTANGQQTVIILDYKTGSSDNDSLQMPLYACMWQEKYTDHVVKTGFYSLKDGRVSWYPKRLNMEEFMQGALQIAQELVMEMKKGVFSPTPYKAEECRYCYHNPLCKASK